MERLGDDDQVAFFIVVICFFCHVCSHGCGIEVLIHVASDPVDLVKCSTVQYTNCISKASDD